MNASLQRRTAFGALILSLVLCSSVFAQHLEPATHAHEAQVAPFCATDFARLHAHAAQLALNQNFQGTRTTARQARAGQDPPEIGDEKQFTIGLGGRTSTFVLRDKSDLHYAWVEQGELARVTDAMLADLHTALVERTPEGSYNPDQGIIANLEELFGRPHNYDGDGIVDFVFFLGGNGPGGFVDLPQVNDADVIYLNTRGWDIPPDVLPAAAAHEYTHLIHLNYVNLDDFEDGFLPEGIAEYGRYALGYTGLIDAPNRYYRSSSELNLPLFQFRPRSDPNFRQDYWRAGLFHLYLADRFSPSAIRDILQNSVNAQGSANYRSVLPTYAITLEELVTDFHLATYLNDRTIDSRFGYTTPGFEAVRSRDHPAAFIRHIDGSMTTFTDMTEIGIGPGAVQYFVWDHVQDFSFDIGTERPELMRLRAVLERTDGTVEVAEDMEPGMTEFSGDYDRVMVAAIQPDPESISYITVAFSATWKENVGTDIEAVAEAPSAFALESNYPNPFADVTTLRYRIGQAGPVELAIYDVLGRRVATLVEETAVPGEHAVVWDGRDGGGAHAAAGVYLARMQAGGAAVQSRVLLLLK